MTVVDLVPYAFFFTGDDHPGDPVRGPIIQAITILCIRIRNKTGFTNRYRDLADLAACRNFIDRFVEFVLHRLQPAGICEASIHLVPDPVEWIPIPFIALDLGIQLYDLINPE